MSVRQRKDDRLIVKFRDPQEQKGIPIRSVKQRPLKLLPYPALNCQNPGKEIKIILRHGFLTMALQDCTCTANLWEMVGASPQALRQHYQHVTSVLHRNTVDQILGIEGEEGTSPFLVRRPLN